VNVGVLDAVGTGVGVGIRDTVGAGAGAGVGSGVAGLVRVGVGPPVVGGRGVGLGVSLGPVGAVVAAGVSSGCACATWVGACVDPAGTDRIRMPTTVAAPARPSRFLGTFATRIGCRLLADDYLILIKRDPAVNRIGSARPRGSVIVRIVVRRPTTGQPIGTVIAPETLDSSITGEALICRAEDPVNGGHSAQGKAAGPEHRRSDLPRASA
jgi:hypothetical protein